MISIRITSLYIWVPALICGFCIENSDFRTRITCLYESQTSPMAFCIQNSDFSTRIASLYGSQHSSVVLCIHNCDIMTRINSLYWSQTSPVVLCMQKKVISIRITSLYICVPALICGFARKTATLGPELHVSRVPDLTCHFVHAKQRDYHQNNLSPWVPDLTCRFVHAKQRV